MLDWKSRRVKHTRSIARSALYLCHDQVRYAIDGVETIYSIDEQLWQAVAVYRLARRYAISQLALALIAKSGHKSTVNNCPKNSSQFKQS